MLNHVIQLTRHGSDRVRAGHPWIFRGDVQGTEGVEGGEIARVVDARGQFLAWAFYSSQSLIALRLLTREDRRPGEAFWSARLERALALRQLVVRDTNACRVVYGDSDGLPSIIVDRYGDGLVLQTLSQGSERIKDSFLSLLIRTLQPLGVVERNDAKTRALEGLPLVHQVLYGEVPAVTEVVENGVRFLVDLQGGQKTGFFLDQRENRVAALAYTQGRALDCFTYSGGFALHMAGRAAHVMAVDFSAPALEQGRNNAAANGLSNVTFVQANVFDFLHACDRDQDRFDTIVLDPPAFAKHKDAVQSAARGYKELNLRALKILNPGGVLVTCSCSFHMSETLFWRMLQEAASDAHRSVQLLEKRTQARDHPILLSLPESYYLKCFVLRAT